MGKFFNKGPKIKICSMCGEEREVFKSMRKGLTSLYYCEDCYNGTVKKIEDRVREYVMKKVKSGKLISIAETTELTEKFTAEIQAEREAKKNGKKETNKSESTDSTNEIKSK